MLLDILYATQTGNAETVAKKLELLAKNQGFNVNLVEMNNHDITSFRLLRNVAIVTSTFGNGEVPEMGIDFWEELKNSDVKLAEAYFDQRNNPGYYNTLNITNIQIQPIIKAKTSDNATRKLKKNQK